MRLKFISFSNLTLLVALSLSSVAAYYSIIGLTAIFAGAVVPVIIMGSILEVGKITTTVWLRKYWHRAGWVLKAYLVPAVIALAVLTSMGIFGFLSKAHMEQGITSGDAQGKVAIYDEKIKTAKDNIEANRKALKQMDEAVDQVMGRSNDEKGADKAVAIRRSQAKERTRLQNEIATEQTTISKLSEERAPLASELRKVEAEVGPIKYIAALIYGDNADQNMLEAAVRWVIILLVVVFDPLAIALVLAANASKEWDENDDVEQENKLREQVEHEKQMAEIQPIYVADVTMPEPEDFTDINHELQEAAVIEEPVIELPIEDNRTMAEKHPYLNQPFSHFTDTKPIVATKEEPVIEEVDTFEETRKEVEDNGILAFGVDVIDRPGDYLVSDEVTADTSMPVMPEKPFKVDNAGYISFEGKRVSPSAFKEMRPDLFALTVDAGKPVNSSFGTKFPETANKGDIFVRVDVLPNKVFKFDGRTWISVNKENSNTYLYNTKYVEYLIDMIGRGEYDAELLSENERIQIEDYLRAQKKKNG